MKNLFAFIMVLLLGGCSTLQITQTSSLPAIKDVNSISLFSLQNYTDTPQAGMRASNLIEGVLITRGYKVVDSISMKTQSLEEMLKAAKDNGSDYLLSGGVSEWRYKTGIDGEPAISLQCKIIEVSSGTVVWSATASSNDWGNASIGTTAQTMIEEMFQVQPL